jgi:hypothetical protein
MKTQFNNNTLIRLIGIYDSTPTVTHNTPLSRSFFNCLHSDPNFGTVPWVVAVDINTPDLAGRS